MPDQQALLAATTRAIACAATADDDGLADALAVISDGGPNALFGACCAFAETVKLLQIGDKGDGYFGLQIVDGTTGATVEPADASPDARPMVWASQFAVAYANDDRDAAMALFFADVQDDDRLVDNVLALVHLAAWAVRSEATGR